ncbi:DUF6350 family protein [Cellulomonas sp. KRMCY2]|uniref:cell division protein PerM n=1 Tax=Cellulomonas sp. KRMCY2 TaxID=1304865 RepID=UPI00045E9C3E|nr:DUF6350 family protein [Cellulomonas sp. KRMCY2]
MSRTPTPRDRAAARTPAAQRTGSAGPSPVDGAPRWVSGLLSGAQAALLSFLVVTMPALAAYVATSADPSNLGIGWPRAVAVGGALWLLGHGGLLSAGGTVVTLVPLGITALAVFSAYASARRSAHPTLSAWLAGIGGYGVVVAAVVLVAGESGPLGAGPGAVVRLVLGTLLVAGTGLGAGIVRVRRLRERTRRWWSRIHAVVRAGAAAGTLALTMVVGVAALVTSAWVLAGRAATGDVVDGLGVDTFGGLLLAVAQLALAPNLVLWAMAWLVGPGFAIGQGTVYSPGEVVSGPLPALPMLGALPQPGSEGGPLRWVPLVVVVAGGLAGWSLHRRLTVTRAWHPLAASGCAAVAAGVLAAILTALAGGAVGPGRLAVVGGPVLLIGVLVTGLTAVGAALVAVPSDPVVRAAVARRAADLWRRLRGDADIDLSPAGGGSPAGGPSDGETTDALTADARTADAAVTAHATPEVGRAGT